MSGKNIASATRPSDEAVTLTQLGVGASHNGRAAFTTTSRQVANRSNSTPPARTTDGPPPITDGSKYYRAPSSNCAAKPAPHRAANSE